MPLKGRRGRYPRSWGPKKSLKKAPNEEFFINDDNEEIVLNSYEEDSLDKGVEEEESDNYHY